MRIRIVDAFTDRPFRGNPAGVLLLDCDSFPDDDWLQRVAAEINLSETAFAHPMSPGGEADWALRWFTPTAEVALCGHATLATAHVLAHTDRDTNTGTGTGTSTRAGTVRFATRSGVLTTQTQPDGSLTLDFPTSPLTPLTPSGTSAHALELALSTVPLSVHDTSENLGDLLVEVTDERTVRALAPDFAALAPLADRGVIVTAAAHDPAHGYDFVSRAFYPALGINEDPVTGSAHTALAPFWSRRLGRAELTGHQASARGGLVRTTLRGDRTLLTGGAVTVIDGELLVAPHPLP